MISIERLEKIAAETSFQAATVERVIRLIDALDGSTVIRFSAPGLP